MLMLAPALLLCVLLAFSALVQYGMLLPLIVRSAADAKAEGAANAPAPAADDNTDNGTDTRPLLYSRSPVAWCVVLGTVYGVAWLMETAHFALTCLVDNSPAQNPPRADAAAALLGSGGAPVDEASLPRCRKCGGVKPARCHHCSACGRCCLKFDHHCPFFGNCIGFCNYKFFLCFLGWALVLCALLVAEAVPVLAWMLRGHADVAGAGTAFFAFVGATFFVAALGMLVTHVELASLNATTFERPQITLFGLHPNRRAGAADRAPYDLGVRANWRQVFGPRPALWLLPVFSSLGDGYSFPENDLDKEP